MGSKLPSSLKELAECYDFSSKYMSKEFKKLAYTSKETPPRKLGILSPKRVIIFFEKFGKPDNELPS
jgi:hypothetical protein